MVVTEENGSVHIFGLTEFSVAKTFDCGQCFRFETTESSAVGYAFGREISFFQPNAGELVITPCSLNEFEVVWKKYLSLDLDYSEIRKKLSSFRKNDKALETAMETGSGIRILRQDKWETLCSFIISQNNNIPRIKKIIASLCVAGAELCGGNALAFPSPDTLVKMGVDGIFSLKTGFRAKYLYDAAYRVASGETDLEAISKLDSERAMSELCKIKGVGPKVVACTLLFGFERYDCFPVDVWVKRVMEEYYGGNVSGKDFGEYAGLAQQYLFYHKRYVEKQ